jgi:DNA mismatch endonuclease (patch repair protein)
MEVAVRSALHRGGRRFRKDQIIVADSVRVRPDILFTGARVAVFIDGCFFHCCPVHFRTPKRNLEYWVPKLERNVQRDRLADRALKAEGWRVVRIWTHEELEDAIRVINQVLEIGIE